MKPNSMMADMDEEWRVNHPGMSKTRGRNSEITIARFMVFRLMQLGLVESAVRLLSSVVRHGRLVVCEEGLAAFGAYLFVLVVVVVFRLLVVRILAVWAYHCVVVVCGIWHSVIVTEPNKSDADNGSGLSAL